MPEPELPDDGQAPPVDPGPPRRGDPEPREHPDRPASGPGSRGGSSPSTRRRAKQARRSRSASSSSAPARPPSPKARTRELELALGRALTFPAVPVIMLPLDAESKGFLATHFTTEGPRVAKELAAASEQSTELRELLERAAAGSLTMTLAVAAVAYLAPPVLWSIGRRGEAQAMQLAMQLDEQQLAALAEQALEQQAAAAAAGATIPPDGGQPGSERQPSPEQGRPPAAAEPAAGE